VRDIKLTPFPLCPWQAIERALKMFSELSEGCAQAPTPKIFLDPSESISSREHDLNPKNILGAIRFFAPLLDRSAETEKCSWT
jgi:hypothetical protein